MPTLNVAAAAQAYIDNHRAARPFRDAVTPALYAQRLQALAALTAAEEVWHALTGLTGQDAMDHAERMVETVAPAALLTTAGGAEGSLLVTLWPDGTGEVAQRADGRWGIPQPLELAP